MIFSQVFESINKSQKRPVAIKVNQEWLEQQHQQYFVLRNPNENLLEKYTGIQVIVDDNVNAFEFIYDK